MLVVTGAVSSAPEDFARLRAACLAHVRRSRTEQGCLAHTVHVDCEDPYRLFFFERWESRLALDAHFAAPGTAEFMKAVRELATSRDGPHVDEVLKASLEEGR